MFAVTIKNYIALVDDNTLSVLKKKTDYEMLIYITQEQA